MIAKRGDKKVKSKISPKQFFGAKNRKGLSGIVTALILIVLVLVATGIVWAVYNSIFKDQGEKSEFDTKCLTLKLDVNSLSCDATECTAVLERGIGSNQEFDGIEYSFVNSENSTNWEPSEGNIAVKSAISTTEMTNASVEVEATEVQIRIYFNKEDATKYYCSPAIVYEKP